LLYAGKTLAEVAGYDDSQLSRVIFRRRDGHGALVRGDTLPPWVHVDSNGMRVVKDPRPFAEVFRRVKKWQGLEKEQAEQAWKKWRGENPKYGVGGEG
jgi:hypothetical protein